MFMYVCGRVECFGYMCRSTRAGSCGISDFNILEFLELTW